MSAWTSSFALRGPGGEPVDLRRTIDSHGLTSLPPMFPHEGFRGFDVALRMPVGPPLLVTVRGAGATRVKVSSTEAPADDAEAKAVVAGVKHLMRLDQDLSGFYALLADDPDLVWVVTGAGRMMRGQTVFEDVVKTICTTNCAWSGTVRMVGALVEHLGEPARGGDGRHAFPTPEAMAAASESFYAETVRAGYRGPYLRTLAAAVADGTLDLESLATATAEDLPDDVLEEQLLGLAGVGPYAAAHIMMLLGRHHRLVLDSWTRPTWAKLNGRTAKDPAIVKRFTRYGPWAGLAFWLRLTESWVADTPR